jgi:hypothetical protein
MNLLQLSRLCRAAAVVGVLIGLFGTGGSAHAQTVGQPCTTPDGHPGTFQESVDPFTGRISIVCSETGGNPRLRNRPLPSDPNLYMEPVPWLRNCDPCNPINFFDLIGRQMRGEAPLGGPVQFSLFGSDSASGVYAGLGTSSTWNSGYRVTDTAGAIPPNSLAPGFRSLESGAGVNITADGARLFDFNGNQKLLFGVTFDYRRSEMDFGTSALTPGVASAGSVRRDTYTLRGSADYSIGTIYFSGRAAVDWSHADITNAVLQSQGDTNGRGYSVSATAGKIFPLFNSTGVNPAMFVKAAPRSVGGYAVFLDLSGRLGYRNMRDDGFTDTSGFIYGSEQLSFWTLGGRANLVAVIPNGRFAWMPYVGVTFDQQLGFRHTFDIPNQAPPQPIRSISPRVRLGGACRRAWTSSTAAGSRPA